MFILQLMFAITYRKILMNEHMGIANKDAH